MALAVKQLERRSRWVRAPTPEAGDARSHGCGHRTHDLQKMLRVQLVSAIVHVISVSSPVVTS